jgi:hypothetical protein
VPILDTLTAVTTVADEVPLLARPEPTRRPVLEWLDRFAGSDPGLNRFRMAFQCVLSIAAVIGAEWLFMHWTHALLIDTHGATLPAAQAAQVAAQHYELLVVAMLLGSLVAMLTTFGVSEVDARGQLRSSLFVPLPMVAAFTVGLAASGHRVLSLILLGVLLAGGTYLRRFGPLGFLAGLLLFIGDFLGYFLAAAFTLSDLGWVVAEIGVGVVVTLAIRFGLFYPRPAKALVRTQRSYGARARKVIRLALAFFDAPTDRGERRLARQLTRLNETALMIDAQLGDPSALPDGSSAQQLHQLLFDAELALTNIARFTQAMARMALPEGQRTLVRAVLFDLCEDRAPAAVAAAGQLTAALRALPEEPGGADRTAVVVPHRFAGSVVAFAEALETWMALGAEGVGERGQGAFEPQSRLAGGWLMGSALPSASASMERGADGWDRVRLKPYIRTAIQMGVAVGLAITFGDLLSGRRFYWAVIAAFITFMGTNNAGEQIRKALFRVAGTVVGIGIGSGLAQLVGHHSNYSIAVILVSLFFGLYLMRINYAFMVVGVTVMVSQLYVQLGEFTNSLLVLRLEETALGAAVAILTVMLVLPVRSRHVLRVAMRGHLEAMAGLVGDATRRLVDPGAEVTLRADARRVDVADQALLATAEPLRRNLFGDLDDKVGEAVALAGASRNYGRNLVGDVEAIGPFDEELCAELSRGCETLNTSMATLVAAVEGPRQVPYTRSSALFDRAERRLEDTPGTVAPGQLAIRDLKLIDGAMARLAEVMGLPVTSYDTASVRSAGNG